MFTSKLNTFHSVKSRSFIADVHSRTWKMRDIESTRYPLHPLSHQKRWSFDSFDTTSLKSNQSSSRTSSPSHKLIPSEHGAVAHIKSLTLRSPYHSSSILILSWTKNISSFRTSSNLGLRSEKKIPTLFLACLHSNQLSFFLKAALSFSLSIFYPSIHSIKFASPLSHTYLFAHIHNGRSYVRSKGRLLDGLYLLQGRQTCCPQRLQGQHWILPASFLWYVAPISYRYSLTKFRLSFLKLN